MSADRSDLHDLVNAMPREQLPFAIADLRRRLNRPRVVNSAPFAWVGAITDSPSDASSPERIDEVLAQGFGR